MLTVYKIYNCINFYTKTVFLHGLYNSAQLSLRFSGNKINCLPRDQSLSVYLSHVLQGLIVFNLIDVDSYNLPINKLRLNELKLFHQVAVHVIRWFRIKKTCYINKHLNFIVLGLLQENYN